MTPPKRSAPMPMELLFVLAQSKLPMMIEKPCDVDKLRVLAAAQLVEVQLHDVRAKEQKAEVLAISPQGRAAPASADWLPSLESCQVQRGGTRTTLDS